MVPVSGVSIPAVWYFLRSDRRASVYSRPSMRALCAVLCYVVLLQIAGLCTIALALFEVISLPHSVRLPDWSPYAAGEMVELLGSVLLSLFVTPFIVFVVAYGFYKIRSLFGR